MPPVRQGSQGAPLRKRTPPSSSEATSTLRHEQFHHLGETNNIIGDMSARYERLHGHPRYERLHGHRRHERLDMNGFVVIGDMSNMNGFIVIGDMSGST
jgi:hypothetical protein